MVKKKTLLYLDDNLVEHAKKAKLNMSKITEQAIRSSLEVKRISFDPRHYLEELLDEEFAFFIPVEIESIEMSNCGPLKKLKANFDKFNIITGENGSGKTAIINAIYNALMNTGRVEEAGKVKMGLKTAKSFEIVFNRNRVLAGYKCLLIDDAFNVLTTKEAIKLLNYLKTLKMQVIITCLDLSRIDLDNNLNGVNIIKL